MMERQVVGRLPLALAPVLFLVAGCGGMGVAGNSTAGGFTLTPGASSIDTNCTGCNSTNGGGKTVHRFAVSGEGESAVNWSLAGGDAASGAGTINSAGEYTPPSYLTADRVEVLVTARLSSGATATAALTLTPGFLQPLTPENVALGANGQVTLTGYLAEAGGNTDLQFALASGATGRAGTGLGALSGASCQHGSQVFTFCKVTYTAPATVTGTSATYVVATVGGASTRASAQVLLNAAGISSNPAAHQAQSITPAALGSSGGNNHDFDTQGSQIVDCCSGTLGALVKGSDSREYLLSNNHVLARSDHATVGDAIVQPGLIDNNCTPSGEGPGTTPVAALTGWLPLSSGRTNVDAAIAQLGARSVDPAGSILELGAKQTDGTLAAAPPGISSSGGKGEAAQLNLRVAKSGRTTGLTCGNVTALDLDVKVDYFTDCAETRPYLTKTFSNQLGISGNQFSDAGDSGALVVDTANAEPVGLFFAGGVDSLGVNQGVANPAPEVLSELSAQLGGGSSFTFVGGADHAVSCLHYGDNTLSGAQSRTLSDVETWRAQQALSQARTLVNPSAGILGVTTGKSNDRAGEAAVIVYTDENMNPTVPATVGSVRTLVIPTNAHAVAFGSAPLGFTSIPPLPAAALAQGTAVKRLNAQRLMRENAGFFAVGIGQSLDNPKEAALVIYLDRKAVPAELPATIDGLRTHYIVMDRLHVTRSYATPLESRRHCMPKTASSELLDGLQPRSLKLN